MIASVAQAAAQGQTEGAPPSPAPGADSPVGRSFTVKATFHTCRSGTGPWGIAPGGWKLELVTVICPFYHTHFRADAHGLTCGGCEGNWSQGHRGLDPAPLAGGRQAAGLTQPFVGVPSNWRVIRFIHLTALPRPAPRGLPTGLLLGLHRMVTRAVWDIADISSQPVSPCSLAHGILQHRSSFVRMLEHLGS